MISDKELARQSFDNQTEKLKVPPHSLDAEQAVLGGLLLDNKAWDQIADRITEKHFYRHDHQLIFRVMTKLVEQNDPIDVITVSDYLKRIEQLDQAGGLAYLGDLAKNTPSAANIAAYTDIVYERAVLRELISIGAQISEAAFDPQGRASAEILDEAERKVFDIAESGIRGSGPEAIRSIVAKAIDNIEKRFHDNSPITGIASGFSDLDKMTAGMQPGDLIIIAGRPSMGKTVLGMNVAEHAAIRSQKSVLVFSMEMPGESLVMRMLSSIGRIDQNKLRTGKLVEEDWTKLTSAVSFLSQSKLYIDETPALTPMELRARARRVAREGSLGLIVVDYLQLMRGQAHVENRTAEISEISRSLKALAKELRVPVIALSQLNRSLEQRPNKRPVMSDLRECVTADTLVCLADRTRVPIKQLVGSQPDVFAMNEEQKIVVAKSDLVWSKGIKPVFKMMTASGRILKATQEHRIFTDKGWKKLSECQNGHRIAVAREFEANTTEILQSKEVKMSAESDLLWDAIVSIEYIGEEEVFDLTVPDVSSWLADGMVSHNSGAIEQDADLIVFIYRDEVYNEDSPDKGTAEIIIGKQRNGPIGTVRLTFLGQYARFENFMSEHIAPVIAG